MSFQTVHEANVESGELHENVGRVFQQVAKSESELGTIQARHWDESHQMSKQLQVSLQDINQREIGALADAVYDMRDQLVGHGFSSDS